MRMKKELLFANKEIMKAVTHNRVLLCVILSKLGMEDNEIDDLNKTICETMEKLIKQDMGEEDGETTNN